MPDAELTHVHQAVDLFLAVVWKRSRLGVVRDALGEFLGVGLILTTNEKNDVTIGLTCNA